MGEKNLKVQAKIEQKIRDALQLEYLNVINESHKHNVPPGSESHFKVIIVSTAFDNIGRVKRHQQMNAILAEELAGPVHALSMETLTIPEWKDRREKKMESPPCRGGGRGEA